MAAGYKVGVYSSPHLVRYRSVSAYRRAGERPYGFVAAIEAARGDTSLAYFVTARSLWLFKQQNVDVAILESGPRRAAGYQHC